MPRRRRACACACLRVGARINAWLGTFMALVVFAAEPTPSLYYFWLSPCWGATIHCALHHSRLPSTHPSAKGAIGCVRGVHSPSTTGVGGCRDDASATASVFAQTRPFFFPPRTDTKSSSSLRPGPSEKEGSVLSPAITCCLLHWPRQRTRISCNSLRLAQCTQLSAVWRSAGPPHLPDVIIVGPRDGKESRTRVHAGGPTTSPLFLCWC